MGNGQAADTCCICIEIGLGMKIMGILSCLSALFMMITPLLHFVARCVKPDQRRVVFDQFARLRWWLHHGRILNASYERHCWDAFQFLLLHSCTALFHQAR